MSSYKQTTLTTIEIPQPPSEGPLIIDDFALALTLGIRCKTLWYCIDRKQHLYKRFTIPKKNGKKRVIFNPQPVLKHVQKRINDVLLKQFAVQDCVGAYVEGRSCRDSAVRHAGHKVRVAIAAVDVGLDYLGIVDLHAVRSIDRHSLTQHGLRRFELHDVGRRHVAGNYVVGQDRYQLVLVLRLKQRLDRAGGQLREGIIRGREDSERTLALQCFHQSGRFHGGDQRLERARSNGCVDDIGGISLGR